jgi:hypothetical protein
MTVAATIEIGAGAIPAPGLGKALGSAQGAGRAGAATFELLSSTVSAATSFRANWQSLLASLNSSMEGYSETEANQGTASAVPASGQAPETTSVSTLAAGMGLHLVQTLEKGSVEAGAIAKLSMAGARTQAMVAKPVAGTAKPASARNEETKPAAGPESESVRSSRPARSIATNKPDTVQSEPLLGLVPAAIASPIQAVPVAAIPRTSAYSTDVPAQLAQTEISVELSIDQPAAYASASFDSHPLARNATGKIAETVSQAVQQPVEGSETHTQQKQASPVPSQSGSSGPTFSEAEVSATGKDAPPPVAMLAVSESSPESPAPSRSQTQQTAQTVATNVNSAETQAPGLALSPALAPQQSRTHLQVQEQNLIQIAAPSQNPIPAQAASPSLTQTTASSKNTTESLTTSQAPSQSLVFNPSPAPSLVQSQKQVVLQPGNQGANLVAVALPGDGLNSMQVAASTTQSGQLAAPSPILCNSTSASDGKASTPETVRPVRGAGNIDSGQQISHLIAGQSSVPAVDASAMVRALTRTDGTLSTTGQPAGASSVTASRPDSREAFATLDAEGTPAAPAWFHTGTQRAEAGYQDPALGWVSVRADLSGGGIHAQLVPGSADAAQVLGSHLTGLNAYLSEHHTPVETLTLTSPEGGWSGLGSGRGAGEGMQQGAGQQSAQNADASVPSGSYPESVIQSPAASAELPAFFGDMDGSTQSASIGGFHISVMA